MFLADAQGVTYLAMRTIRAMFKRPFPFRLVLEQMDKLGVQSLPVILLTGLFTGFVLAVQGMNSLKPFGGELLIVNGVTATLVRELGPVLAGLMVSARVGAGIASELGSMTVTNQIDALRVFGADPHQYLVLPRLLALTLMLPLLVSLTCLIGLLGAHLIVVYDIGFSDLYFWEQVQVSLRGIDIITGLVKSVAYAWVIVLIACYVGFSTRGGTEAVGQSTTKSVVVGSITLLIVNFFLTQLFYGAGH